MKFQPLLGTGMSGSVGGVTASHNTYGSYFRKKVKPVNPKSPGMAIQRAAFGAASQAWRTLPTATQLLWVAAAPTLPKISKSGNRVILTGQALFMSVNTLPLKAGAPLITLPPSSSTAAGLTAPTVSIDNTGVVTITFAADDWNVANGVVDVSISPPISGGRNFIGQFNSLATFKNPGTSPVTATPGFLIPPGSNVQLNFIAETPDGRKSQTVNVPVTSAAAGGTITIVSVASSGALITFSAPVNVTAGDILLRNTTGSNNLVAVSNTTGTTTTFSGTGVGGDAWNTSTTDPAIAAQLLIPQSGTIS